MAKRPMARTWSASSETATKMRATISLSGPPACTWGATVAPIVHEAGGGADKEVVARIFVAPTDDADTVRGMGRFAIAAYLNVPVYAAFHEWLGRGDRLGDMWRLWKEGDRKAALAAIPDSVVDELIVWGPPEKCREHLQRYVDNGVTTPAIALLPFGYDVQQAVRDLAPR